MNPLLRRVEALEAANDARSEIMRIVIRGGLPDSTPFNFASSGDLKWNRLEGEEITSFRARAEAEALAAGEKFISFGGLTPYE